MMYSIEDFETIEKLKESKASDFDTTSRGDVMARILLVSASNLELVKEEIETTPELAEHIEDKHKFQHTLIQTSVHTLYSVFRSVKYHSYNSTYRDIRFLIESWLLLRGLNERKAKASELWKTYRKEVKSHDGDTPMFDSDSVDQLGRIRDSEQDKLYNDYPFMREVMNYISQRAAHPLRADGSYLEGVSIDGQKHEQIYLSLSLLFVLTKEYESTLEETQLEDHISEYIETILTQIKKAMPMEVPVFLSPYLD